MRRIGVAIAAGLVLSAGAVVLACKAVQGRAPATAAASSSAATSAPSVAPSVAIPLFVSESARAAESGFRPTVARAVADRAVLHTFEKDGCVEIALVATARVEATVRVGSIERWSPELLPARSALSGPLCGRAHDALAVEARGGPVTALVLIAEERADGL